ncbi:hypothetical protein ACOJBO_10940 [Rhizobium beringeri]
MFVDGENVSFRKPMDARGAGIAMIHQELQQVPHLSVAQNMFLSHPLTTVGGLFVRGASRSGGLPKHCR